jgi:hypothetical protein
MEFKDLLKATKEAKLASLGDGGTDPRTRNARLGIARRAQEDLLGLFNDYKNEVRKRIVFILPTGPSADKFTELSSKEFGCFAVDAEGVYKDSIKNINPVLFNNSPFNPALLDTAVNYFQDVAEEIGLISYPMVIYKNTYARTLKNQQELLDIVKEAFNADIGSEVVGYYAIHKATNLGLESEFAGKIMPVILTTSDLKLIASLEENLKTITNNIFVVDTKETITEKEIEKIFTNIKKTIKTIN